MVKKIAVVVVAVAFAAAGTSHAGILSKAKSAASSAGKAASSTANKAASTASNAASSAKSAAQQGANNAKPKLQRADQMAKGTANNLSDTFETIVTGKH